MEKVNEKSAEFFRILQKENIFVLEFGKEEDENINIIAHVEIEDSKLVDCVLKMLSAGMKYQKETGKDIGFPNPENE